MTYELRANGRFVPGEPCFFVCCGHTAKFLLSSVTAGRVCTAPRDRLEGWHERDASTPRAGNFDPFPQDPACCRGWKNVPCTDTCHSFWESGGLRNPHSTLSPQRSGTSRFVLAKPSSQLQDHMTTHPSLPHTCLGHKWVTGAVHSCTPEMLPCAPALEGSYG